MTPTLLLLIASLSLAADLPTTNEATVVEFRVEPASPPEAALAHRFSTPLFAQTAGDAAPLYYQAFMSHAQPKDDAAKKIEEAISAPRDQFNVDEATKLLPGSSYFSLLDLASSREQCRWAPPIREQGFATLLPYLQQCRTAGTALCLRAKIAAAAGRYDEALRSLKTGFVMVNHLKQDAVLIQGLVAVSISARLFEQAAFLEQSPGAPNLYWAFATVRRPVIDVPLTLESERIWMVSWAPELREKGPRELAPAELDAIFARIPALMRLAEQDMRASDQLQLAATVASAYPNARQWLLSHNMKQKEVDDMTPLHAVAIYTIESYIRDNDALFKWSYLPYWTHASRQPQLETTIIRDPTASPLTKLLLPAVSKAQVSCAKTERRLAAQQTVEALRAYAAAHGKFPATLGDIIDTPAPLDPMTGKDFAYELKDGVAFISSDAGREERDKLRFRVTLVEGKK